MLMLDVIRLSSKTDEEEELVGAGAEFESVRNAEELMVDVIGPASTLAGTDEEDADELLGRLKLPCGREKLPGSVKLSGKS